MNIKHANELFRQLSSGYSTAVIVGKGPSLNKDYVLQQKALGSLIIGINEVCNIFDPKDIHVTVFNDHNVIGMLNEAHFARPLVTPIFQHIEVLPKLQFLPFYIDIAPKLLLAKDLLYFFDSRTTPFQHFKNEAILDIWNTTCESALHLLGQNGIKDVILVGIDGGTQYSADFSYGEMPGKTFDMQWRPIKWAIKKWNMNVRHYLKGPV